MATIGNAPVFPTESVLPGNLEVTGNATISGSSATVNGDEVRTVGTSGAILQVVQGTTSTQVAVNTTTYTDTTLSASITPSSSSNKILVYVLQEFVALRSADGVGLGIRLLRDSTTIWAPIQNSTGPYLWYTDDQELDGYASINFLDSPATTSSVTYKTQGRPYNTANSGRVNFQNSGGVVISPVSTIILMEVVA
jgi:hypothetical protein